MGLLCCVVHAGATSLTDAKVARIMASPPNGGRGTVHTFSGSDLNSRRQGRTGTFASTSLKATLMGAAQPQAGPPPARGLARHATMRAA